MRLTANNPPTPARVAAALGALDATQAATAQAGMIPERNPATVYASGFLVQDSTGIYRGDGATAGGVLQASPSFELATTETFSRSGVAIDLIDGSVAADGAKSTRTVRWLDSQSSVSTIELPSGINLCGCTHLGTLFAIHWNDGGVFKLLRSTDNGLTRTAVITGTATANNCTVFELIGDTKYILFCFINSGGVNSVRVSLDDGLTWSATVLPGAIEATWDNCTPQFSSNVLVVQPTGVSRGDSFIIVAAYGAWSNRTQPRQNATRIFRTTATISQIEAGSTDWGWTKIWQANMPAMYGATPGLGLIPANVLISDGVATAGGASTLTETGKFAALALTATPLVEILTDPNGTPAGAAVGQVRHIASKTNDELTLTAAWAVVPSAGATYRVVGLNATGEGMHMHAAAYDAAGDNLYVALGDNTSHNVVKLAAFSTLTGATLVGDVAEQPVNWAATSLVTNTEQPTVMHFSDGKLWCAATDLSIPSGGGGGYSGYIDPATGKMHATVYDWLNCQTAENFSKTWDGVPVVAADGNYVFHSNQHIYAGPITGPTEPIRLAVDPTSGLNAGMPSAHGECYAINSGSDTIHNFVRVHGIDEFTGVYLGRVVTNIAPNADFAAIGGTEPTVRPNSWTASGANTVFTVETTGDKFGACNFARATMSGAGSPTWENATTAAPACVENDVIRFTGYWRFAAGASSTASGTVKIRFYDAANAALAAYVSGTPTLYKAGGIWQRSVVTGTAPASTAKVRCGFFAGGANGDVIDISLPTVTKTGGSPVAPATSTRAAESLRYAVGTGSHSKTKCELLLKPVLESSTDAVRAEDILSIQDHDGYRLKITYDDDGAGTKAFTLRTYTSAGVSIAATSLGYVRHSIYDPLRIVLRWENRVLSAEVSSHSTMVRGQQSWLRNWQPATIALGEDLWATGTETANRFCGLYVEPTVSQR